MKFTDGFMIHSGQPVLPFGNLTYKNRLAISLIPQLVMFYSVKVFSVSKSRFSPMNFLVERARNLFLMPSLLLNPRRLMHRVLVNLVVSMSILVLLNKRLLLPSLKGLSSNLLGTNRVDIRKVDSSRRFTSSFACRE